MLAVEKEVDPILISILVLTDDVPEWVNKFHQCLYTVRERKTKDGYHLENPLFVVDIESDVENKLAGSRYTYIIVDKPVPRDYEQTVLRPFIIMNIEHTERYYRHSKQ